MKIQRQRDQFAYRIADMAALGEPGTGGGSSANSAQQLVNQYHNDAATNLGNQINGTPYEYGGSGKGSTNVSTGQPSNLYDCSGLAGDVLSMFKGENPNGEYATDASGTRLNTTSDMRGLGLEPGAKPGALNVGVNPQQGTSGHMDVQLPSGQGMESAGSGEKFGDGAKPVSQFQQQWHLPKSEIPTTSTSKSLNDMLLGGGTK